MDAIPGFMSELPADKEMPIGTILVKSGRLSPADMEIVLQEQRARGGPFGAAAMRLGLVTRADVDYALAQQYDYPYLRPDSSEIEHDVVAAYQPFSPVAERMRVLRSQLGLRWLNRRAGQKSLAITGVARGEGRSFVAANLAVAFAQMGERTLLIDADMRNPVQHLLFHMDNSVGLSSLLAGRARGAAIARIAALRNLWVLPSGPIPPNPQELLGRALFSSRLRTLEGLFDVVIADTTAADEASDGQIVAAASGAALVVVRKDATPMKELRALQSALDVCGSRVLGAVMND